MEYLTTQYTDIKSKDARWENPITDIYIETVEKLHYHGHRTRHCFRATGMHMAWKASISLVDWLSFVSPAKCLRKGEDNLIQGTVVYRKKTLRDKTS